MRLDSRDSFPSGMENYLAAYGWHFNKKMCEWAVSRMYKLKDGKKMYITPYTKEQIDDMLLKHNITVEKNGYDYVFAANMCKADYLASSILDEQHLLLFVKDYTSDPDAYPELPFTRFYADCIGSGTVINWEDMI